MISKVLNTTAHRPWPLPNQPWVMTQTWEKLLFAHWPVPPEIIRPSIPGGLELDLYDGQAWLGLVPFRMSVNPRGIPFKINFCEMNVRTYVTCEHKPGVLFYSLDASDWMTVWGARLTYALPYFLADIQIRMDQESVHYQCRRTHPGSRQAIFEGAYKPKSPVYRSTPGSLDHWLTERYCLYTQRKNTLYRANIHHLPWPLQQAEADITQNSMSEFPLPNIPPLLHYAEHIDMIGWPLEKVRTL